MLLFHLNQFKELIVSLFSVIILTTVAIQRLCMESKNNLISQLTQKQKFDIDRLSKINKELSLNNNLLEYRIKKTEEFNRVLLDEINIILQKKR